MRRGGQHQAMDPIVVLLILLLTANFAVLGAGATKAALRAWRERERRPRHPRGRLID